jgi:hypothetical protein
MGRKKYSVPEKIRKCSLSVTFLVHSLLYCYHWIELNSKLNLVINCIFKWFQNNRLVLNLNKTHMVKFTSPKTLVYPLHTAYNNQALNVIENIKFLGMNLDCHLTWKQHSDNLVKKLSTICFILRKLLPIVNKQVLRMVYFAHFQSQVGYGIIFWGSSSTMRSVFVVQKRAINIMLRLGPRSSCKEGFKKVGILTVPCLYMYDLMLFVVKNPNIYQTNNSIHKLHVSTVRLSSIKKVYIIHRLRYLITFHKVYLNFIIMCIFLKLG